MDGRRFTRALLVLSGYAVLTGAAGCSSVSSSPPIPGSTATRFASSAEIWFHPKPAAGSSVPVDPTGLGSLDFAALFQPNAAWKSAAAHTRVLGLYAGWIVSASDTDLQTTIAFVNAHNMGIEIEAPALQATAACGSGVEGYAPYGQSLHDFTLAYLQRLQTLNAPVPYIKVDEPYYFGSVSTTAPACQWPVAQVASDVGAYVALVKTVYPTATVGDVEPVIAQAYSPDVVTALGQWHDAYKTATGAQFPFFFADVDFSNPAWPTLANSLASAARTRGMHFGIIYIGDPQDTSDAEWTEKVVARFELYQGANGAQPDYVLFQSWEAHPQYCLPETDPTTFTGVLDTYITASSSSTASSTAASSAARIAR